MPVTGNLPGMSFLSHERNTMNPQQQHFISESVRDYLHLAEVAQSRPAQYRAGIEARMRRVWAGMTNAERAEVSRYFEQSPVA